MQYVLTQEELDALRGAAAKVQLEERDKVQKLCTLVAEHMPVPMPWSPESPPRPMGCILLRSHQSGYCDNCPVKADCPHPHKKWSK